MPINSAQTRGIKLVPIGHDRAWSRGDVTQLYRCLSVWTDKSYDIPVARSFLSWAGDFAEAKDHTKNPLRYMTRALIIDVTFPQLRSLRKSIIWTLGR